MEELKKSINEITNDNIVKVVISNKLNKDVEYNKINIQLKEKYERGTFIFAYYRAQREFQVETYENIEKVKCKLPVIFCLQALGSQGNWGQVHEN